MGAKECTQISKNDLSEPFLVIRVHCCAVVDRREDTGVYTDWRRLPLGAVLGHSCTLLRRELRRVARVAQPPWCAGGAPLGGRLSLGQENGLCASGAAARLAFSPGRQPTRTPEELFQEGTSDDPRALRGTNTPATKMLRLDFTVTGGVTKAGLLAAGSYPQQFFPKLHVDVAVHPGMRKGVSGERRFTDRAICEGTLGEMMEGAVVAIAKSLRRTSIVRGMGRIDELEIPEEILRRAIADALIHREYDKRFDGQAVSVNVFDSRTEVVNPGGLWGKSRNSLADDRLLPQRNPVSTDSAYSDAERLRLTGRGQWLRHTLHGKRLALTRAQAPNVLPCDRPLQGNLTPPFQALRKKGPRCGRGSRCPIPTRKPGGDIGQGA